MDIDIADHGDSTGLRVKKILSKGNQQMPPYILTINKRDNYRAEEVVCINS